MVGLYVYPITFFIGPILLILFQSCSTPDPYWVTPDSTAANEPVQTLIQELSEENVAGPERWHSTLQQKEERNLRNWNPHLIITESTKQDTPIYTKRPISPFLGEDFSPDLSPLSWEELHGED